MHRTFPMASYAFSGAKAKCCRYQVGVILQSLIGPKQNVVGIKWVFHNKQDKHGVVTRNKADLW
jgi:hypothetical protein